MLGRELGARLQGRSDISKGAVLYETGGAGACCVFGPSLIDWT